MIVDDTECNVLSLFLRIDALNPTHYWFNILKTMIFKLTFNLCIIT